ncbi:MAG: DNA polymerase III subunit delta [Gemmatimonadales bacterium]
MGALTLDALRRSLKQPGTAPDPVYYLHGDEDVLKEEAVRALLDRALEPGTRDFNFDRRSAADLDPDSFHSLVNTPPMLAARRAVVIRGLEELRKTSKVRQELVRYLGSPSPTTLLILVQGAGEAPDVELVRAATTVAAEPLPPERVRKWVTHRSGQLGLAFEPDAAELLVTVVGNDLGALGQELDKLAALAAGRPATRDDVGALVGVRRGETLEDLVDAALERRAAAAARLVQPVLEQGGMTGVRMLTTLGTALLGTALARAELDRGAPRGRLETIILGHLRATRPYGLGRGDQTAARWAGWAERWTAPRLRRALRLALEADRALKSTTVTDERGILVQLVLSFGMLEQEAA